MKNILTVLLAVVLVLMSCGNDGTPTATAATTNNTTTKPKTSASQPTVTNNKVRVTAKNVTVKSGAEACLNVQVSNFNEIISMQYASAWDTNALKFKATRNMNLEALGNDNFGKKELGNGLLRLSWYHPNLKDISLMDGTTMYQLCFDAVGKSGTTTEVRFGDKRMISEIVNKRNQFFKLDSQPTVVTIE